MAPDAVGAGGMTSLRKGLPARRAEADLITAIASDIAADLAHHIRTMYPQAVKASPGTFLVSVRNHVRNDVEAVLRGSKDEAEIRERLDSRARLRRRIARARDTDWAQQPEAAVIAYAQGDDEIDA